MSMQPFSNKTNMSHLGQTTDCPCMICSRIDISRADIFARLYLYLYTVRTWYTTAVRKPPTLFLAKAGGLL